MAGKGKGINLRFPLRSYRRGFFEANQTTLGAVAEDIKTLLLTRKGERIINTTLGTNISVFAGELFEQISPDEMKVRVSAEIRSALAEWMPHVTLEDLRVLTYDDDPQLKPTQIRIEMDYVLTNAKALGDSIQLTVG